MVDRTKQNQELGNPHASDLAAHENLRAAQPDAKPPRRWPSAVFWFALGVGVSQAFGLWGFLTAVIYGAPPSPFNGTAAIARLVAPEASAKLAATWVGSRGSTDRSGCTTLSLPTKGLEADVDRCPQQHARLLREIPGTSPKNNRLHTGRSLQMTTSAPARAPVAGWAARVGGADLPDLTATDAAASTPSAVPLVRQSDQNELTPGGWSTIAVPDNRD